MKKYDFIIIGAGGAQEFAFAAAGKGLKVALIDEKEPGGTCLNRGCIPTKIMLQTAEVARYIRDSKSFGIDSVINKIDYPAIRNRVYSMVSKWRKSIFKVINSLENLDFYNSTAKFIDNKIIEIDNNKITADKIIINVGMRPLIPKIPGLDTIPFLTNENVLDIDSVPSKIAILGGGYIGMETAYFFQSLGSEVFVIEMKDKLLAEINPDLSKTFNEYITDKVKSYTSTKLDSISIDNNNIDKVILNCSSVDPDKKSDFSITVDKLFVATGRKVNTDKLDCSKTGVKLNKFGFIVSNEFLQTDNKDIFVLGDCAGTPAFRHIANYQCEILIKNLLYNQNLKPDYSVVPYAVFTYPEIASVGLSFEEAKSNNENVESLKIKYFHNTKGRALGYNGFCNAVIDKQTEHILGFHIIGPYASILIHEVIPILTNKLSFKTIYNSVHIHPALSELVNWTFEDVE